jgi:hypothetical protein
MRPLNDAIVAGMNPSLTLGDVHQDVEQIGYSVQ